MLEILDLTQAPEGFSTGFVGAAEIPLRGL